MHGTSDSGRLHFTQETLGPDRAREMLAHPTPYQRVTVPGKVKDYAATMKRGEWKATADPIMITRDGGVIQGRHRLEAVILSGVPLHCTVAWNVDPATFDVLDRGLARHASSFLRGGYRTLRESVGRTLWAVEYDFSHSEMYEAWKSMPLGEQIEYIESWPEMGDYLTAASQGARRSKVSARFVTAICCLADRAGDADVAELFVHGLKDFYNKGLGEGDPRLALMGRFQSHPYLMTLPYLDVAYATCVKAYNLLRVGKPATQNTLTVKAGRDFRPVVWGSDCGSPRAVIVDGHVYDARDR